MSLRRNHISPSSKFKREGLQILLTDTDFHQYHVQIRILEGGGI